MDVVRQIIIRILAMSTTAQRGLIFWAGLLCVALGCGLWSFQLALIVVGGLFVGIALNR
jgi:hypothetical protein